MDVNDDRPRASKVETIAANHAGGCRRPRGPPGTRTRPLGGAARRSQGETSWSSRRSTFARSLARRGARGASRRMGARQGTPRGRHPSNRSCSGLALRPRKKQNDHDVHQAHPWPPRDWPTCARCVPLGPAGRAPCLLAARFRRLQRGHLLQAAAGLHQRLPAAAAREERRARGTAGERRDRRRAGRRVRRHRPERARRLPRAARAVRRLGPGPDVRHRLGPQLGRGRRRLRALPDGGPLGDDGRRRLALGQRLLWDTFPSTTADGCGSVAPAGVDPGPPVCTGVGRVARRRRWVHRWAPLPPAYYWSAAWRSRCGSCAGSYVFARPLTSFTTTCTPTSCTITPGEADRPRHAALQARQPQRPRAGEQYKPAIPRARRPRQRRAWPHWPPSPSFEEAKIPQRARPRRAPPGTRRRCGTRARHHARALRRALRRVVCGTPAPATSRRSVAGRPARGRRSRRTAAVARSHRSRPPARAPPASRRSPEHLERRQRLGARPQLEPEPGRRGSVALRAGCRPAPPAAKPAARPPRGRRRRPRGSGPPLNGWPAVCSDFDAVHPLGSLSPVAPFS